MIATRLIVAALLIAAPCLGSDSEVLVGQVTHIVDGDTLDVQIASGTIRVRLHGIDAPEVTQPHGLESSAVLSARLIEKRVTIESFEIDMYGRLIGIVGLGERNINAEMVSAGDAWAFRRYMRKADAALCETEAAARTAKRGLWALTADVTAPWEYRQRKKRETFTDYGQETAAKCAAAIGKR